MNILKKLFVAIEMYLDDLLDYLLPMNEKVKEQFFIRCHRMNFSYEQTDRMYNLFGNHLDSEKYLNFLSTGIFKQSTLLLDNEGLSSKEIEEAIKPFEIIDTGYCNVLENTYTNKSYNQSDYTNVILYLLESKR